MTLFDVVVAALVQGIAEVLPLGAQGHLAILRGLSGNAEARAAVAVAAHAGVLIALCLYFWRDLAAMAVGLVKLAKGRPDGGTRLLFQVTAASAEPASPPRRC